MEELRQRMKDVIYHFHTNASQISNKDINLQNKLSRQLNKNSSITLEVIMLFLEYFPDLSAEWLLRGEGEMSKSHRSLPYSIGHGNTYVKIDGNGNKSLVNSPNLSNYIDEEATEEEITDADFECIEEIPVVPASAIKAPGVDLMTYVEDNQQHIEQRKVVKGGVIADFIVRVKDVSLMPEYMPGDELYLKEINIDKGILNGNVYAVDTDSKGMIIRVLNDEGDHFIASSFNDTRFRDSIIQKDDVLRIYNITQLRRIPN